MPSADRRRRGPFAPFDRPRVEVRHEDSWRPGRLHGWVRRQDGWWAVVSYPTEPGIALYLCVPAADVRPVAEDAPDT